MIVVELPTLPPSTNNLFANAGKRGRVKTPRYTAWCEAAGWEIQIAKPGHVKGPVAIVMTFGRPDNRRRDVSNLIKPVEDLLVTHGVIEDDSKVQDIRARWSDDTQGCRIVVSEVAA